MTIPVLPTWAEKIRKRCEAATKGPWEFTRQDDYASVTPIIYDHKDNCEANDADYEFMAHSRTDEPRLLVTLAGTCEYIKEVAAGPHDDMCPLVHSAYRHKWCNCCEAKKVLAAVEKGDGDASELDKE